MRNSIIALAVAALSGSSAMAAMVTYNGTFPLASTNIPSTPITLQQWDPAAFGVTAADLVSVKVELTGRAFGRTRLENLDITPSVANYNVSASVTLVGPGGVNITALPVTAGFANLTAYDGVTDFAGPSGFDTGFINASPNTQSFTLFAGFGAYIGAGNIAGLNLSASGSSGGSGGGNLVFQSTTDAGGDFSVTYTWIPAPSSAALLGLGGLLAARRRRN